MLFENPLNVFEFSPFQLSRTTSPIVVAMSGTQSLANTVSNGGFTTTENSRAGGDENNTVFGSSTSQHVTVEVIDSSFFGNFENPLFLGITIGAGKPNESIGFIDWVFCTAVFCLILIVVVVVSVIACRRKDAPAANESMFVAIFALSPDSHSLF